MVSNTPPSATSLLICWRSPGKLFSPNALSSQVLIVLFCHSGSFFNYCNWWSPFFLGSNGSLIHLDRIWNSFFLAMSAVDSLSAWKSKLCFYLEEPLWRCPQHLAEDCGWSLVVVRMKGSWNLWPSANGMNLCFSALQVFILLNATTAQSVRTIENFFATFEFKLLLGLKSSPCCAKPLLSIIEGMKLFDVLLFRLEHEV